MQPPQPPSQPPPPQQYTLQIPYQQPPPYPYYPVPIQPSRKRDQTLVVVIVVVVVLGVVGVIAALTLFKAPPNLAITNFQLTEMRGAFCVSGGPVLYSFTLVNTGRSGFADVAFFLDGSTAGTNRYYVGANSQSPVSDTINVPDCSSHTGSVEITGRTSA